MWLLPHQTKADQPKLVSTKNTQCYINFLKLLQWIPYSVWHHQQILSFFCCSRLNFPHEDRSHVIILINDWHDEWTVSFAIEWWQVIDERNKSWTIIPRTRRVVNGFDALTCYSRHGHESQIFRFKAEKCLNQSRMNILGRMNDSPEFLKIW